MSGARHVRHAPDALALKVASKALVRAAGGGEGAAATVGARQQRMSDCGNPNTADFLRLDEVAALEDVTVGAVDHPIVTRALARRQNFALVRLPDALPTRSDLLSLVARQAKENGEVAASICTALADGTFKRTEARAARLELQQLIEVAVAMDAELAIIEAEAN